MSKGVIKRIQFFILTSIGGIVPLEAAQGLPLGRPAFGATKGQLH